MVLSFHGLVNFPDTNLLAQFESEEMIAEVIVTQSAPQAMHMHVSFPQFFLA